jgi:segregation and condensation protein A
MTGDGEPSSIAGGRAVQPAASAVAPLWPDDDDRRPGEELVVDLAGFEGPLDLLLALARTQKVDLAHISVL